MPFTFRLNARRPCACKLAVLVAAVMFAGISWPQAAPAAEVLRLGGTGGGLANIQRLAEAFAETHPGVAAKVVSSLGSSGGIKALLAGAIDASVSARRLKDDESGKGAVAVEYARTPLVFATRSPAVAGFSRAELVRIYAGDINAWPDGTPIRPVMRPTTEGDTQLLRAMSEDMNRAVDRAYARPGVINAHTDQDNADAMESVPGAIGTSTLGQISAEQRRLRVLAVDDVEPTVAAAASGRYPLFKVLYLVVRNDASPLVRQFVAFVQSAQARPILERQGYWVHDEHPAH